jgi:hypothetical protein
VISRLRASLPVAALLGFAAVAGTLRLRAYDLFWHLASGRWMLAHRQLPRLDPFRFTSVGVPWVDHEWLFQVGIARIERQWGLPALVVGLAFLVVGLAALLYWAARRAGAPVSAAVFVTLIAILGARGRFFLRPELASLAGLAVLLVLLQELRRGGRRPLLLIPLLVAVWVNFHPGALIAPAVVAAYLVGSRLPGGWGPPRRGVEPVSLWVVVLAPLLALLALLANPYGSQVFGVPFGIASALRGLPGTNPEWLPVWKAPQSFFLTGVALLAALAVLTFARTWRVDPATGLAALALTALAATGVRHQGLFFVGAAFFAAELAAQLAGPLTLPYLEIRSADAPANQPEPRWARPAAVLACLLAAFWCVHPPSRGPLRPRQGTLLPGFGIEPGRFPERAVNELARRPGLGNLYNDVAWGGYLLWRLYPPRQVFIDARNEVNPGLLHEIAAARGDEGAWFALLDRYRIDAALVRYDDRPRPVLGPPAAPGEPPRVELHTSNALFFPRQRFALVYWDDVAMLYVRRTPERAGELELGEYRFVHPEDWRPAAARAAADPGFRAAALGELDRRLAADPTLDRARILRGVINGEGVRAEPSTSPPRE